MQGVRKLAILVVFIAACKGQVAVDQQEEADEPRGDEVSNATSEETSQVPTEQLPEFVPPGPKMRRLSRIEYENTIHDLFGVIVEVPDLEPDTNVNGFTSIGNAQISTSRLGVEQYETAALEIANQVMTNPARLNLVDCSPSGVIDGPCTNTFLSDVGRRLFRRPLSDAEVQRYARVALTAARDLNDFWTGLEFGLAALLQSPSFLYRVEWGDETAAPERRRLEPHEIASRLSYFLWASTPDEMLLDAAESGKLDSVEGVRAEAERMLEGSRAKRGLRTLWIEFFQLRGLERQIKDQETYPEFDAALAGSMREETLRLIEHYANDDRDFREIFSTKTTFVDDRLAELYGVSVDAEPGEFVEVTLDDSTPRRGVLGHASFLSLNAHAVQNSPTLRGMFVRQSLLCQPIPPPPPDVDTSIDEYELEGKTLREKLSVHMEQEGCSSCHVLMDPIGFGFENFDALGKYRTEDAGEPVDATGELDGETFEHAGELAHLVADHPGMTTCVVRKLYRHALGHVESDTEERLIRRLDKEWATNDYRMRDLMLDLVTSDGFLYVEGEQ